MITTIIVDDSVICLETLKSICEQIEDLDICKAFLDPLEAWSYAKENPVDCALLDIEMPGLNGIELGKKLREKYPHIVLIFVTCKEEYYSLAMKMKADFYIFKPYEYQDIVEAAQRACLLIKRKEVPIKAFMLGRFNLFINNEAVRFSNMKSKELLALCLDHRGGTVTMEEAIDKLWPEKAYDEKVKRLYRKAISSLKETLAKHTSRELFITNRGSCQIIPAEFVCDYYLLMDNREHAENFEELMDVYLEEYSWSEEIVSRYVMA